MARAKPLLETRECAVSKSNQPDHAVGTRQERVEATADSIAAVRSRRAGCCVAARWEGQAMSRFMLLGGQEVVIGGGGIMRRRLKAGTTIADTAGNALLGDVLAPGLC